MQTEKRTYPPAPRIAERIAMHQERALVLRREGRSFSEIAAELGVGVPTAKRYFYGALDARALPRSTVEEIRGDEMERLAALRSSIWDRATGEEGETYEDQDSAIRMALQIHDRIAKLTGIQAPEKVELSITIKAQLMTVIVHRIEAAMAAANVPVEQRQQVAAALMQSVTDLPGKVDSS